MKNRKRMIAFAITLMVIGFASVSTTLIINGNTNVASNIGDFDVYFSKAIANGVESNNLIQDKTHIAFEAELNNVGDSYEIEYEITNASKNYDVDITLNVPSGNEYLRVENKFDISPLGARTTRKGTLTLTLIKGVLIEERYDFEVTFTVKGTERTSLGGDTIEEEDYLTIITTTEWITPEEYDPYLGHDLDKSKVETINLVASKEIPEGATLIGDVSASQNGSIMMYSKDENSNDMLELYIGQDGGVKANPNSSNLFRNFTNVTRINGLENFNTSMVTDMSGMFRDCGSLTDLNINALDTGKTTNMSYMFAYCSELTSLSINELNTSQVTDMSGMFRFCRKLTNIDITRFDTSNVTNMSYMFNECRNLLNLDVSTLNVENVTNMSHMFNYCLSIPKLDVSTWNTSKVKDMSSLFCCLNLSTLDVSKFNTSQVTNMNEMFLGCKYLKSLDLSGFNTSNVTDMSQMFYTCASFTDLDVSHLNASKTTDISQMFLGCTKLTNLILGDFNPSNAVHMYGLFQECSSLVNLDLSKFDTSKITDMRNVFYGCINLENLDISSFNTSNVTIATGMFANCYKIKTTIVIQGTKCTRYGNSYEKGIFENAATENGAKIIVNYSTDASSLVDKMIATKSSNSNVVKGTQV